MNLDNHRDAINPSKRRPQDESLQAGGVCHDEETGDDVAERRMPGSALMRSTPSAGAAAATAEEREVVAAEDVCQIFFLGGEDLGFGLGLQQVAASWAKCLCPNSGFPRAHELASDRTQCN
jgi:hypothetical protein